MIISGGIFFGGNMLTSYINPNDIKMNLESTEKEECFAELLEVMIAKNPKINRTEAMEALTVREEKCSTAVYPYIAVPHAVCPTIQKTAIAIGISRSGIEFDKSNKRVNIIFEVLFEENNTDAHLHVLRDILQIVSNPDFLQMVLDAKDSISVYDVIASLEN